MAGKRSKQVNKSKQSLYWTALGAFAAGLVIFVLVRPLSNNSAGAISQLTPEQYATRYSEGSEHVLVDVRTPDEFASGHIPGAINIPVDSLEAELDQLPSDQEIVVYCQSGNRSAQASRILAGAGFNVSDLGGIIAWRSNGYPVQ